MTVVNSELTYSDLIQRFNSLNKEKRCKFKLFIDKVVPRKFHNLGLTQVVPQEHTSLFNSVVASFGKEEPISLYLYGGVGVGKTATLYALYKLYFLNKYITILDDFPATNDDYNITIRLGWEHKNARIFTHYNLIKEMRDMNYESEDCTDLPEIADTKILFIDDIGRGYSDKAGWNQALLSEFIDYRWANHLPTYFSSNRNPKELGNFFSPEAIDRLADTNWLTLVRYSGKSHRKTY